MTAYDKSFDGMPRHELEALAARQRTQLAERAAVPLLPGWICRSPTCASPTNPEGGVFNGTVKENRTHCRCCGQPRPTSTR